VEGQVINPRKIFPSLSSMAFIKAYALEK